MYGRIGINIFTANNTFLPCIYGLVDNIALIKIGMIYFMYIFADANACRQSAPCKNGATCTSTGVSVYKCTCATGYTGTNCDQGKKYSSMISSKIVINCYKRINF